MKCPKCNLVTSDKRDSCPRCNFDLRSRKRELKIPVSNSKASATPVKEKREKKSPKQVEDGVKKAISNKDELPGKNQNSNKDESPKPTTTPKISFWKKLFGKAEQAEKQTQISPKINEPTPSSEQLIDNIIPVVPLEEKPISSQISEQVASPISAKSEETQIEPVQIEPVSEAKSIEEISTQTNSTPVYTALEPVNTEAENKTTPNDLSQLLSALDELVIDEENNTEANTSNELSSFDDIENDLNELLNNFDEQEIDTEVNEEAVLQQDLGELALEVNKEEVSTNDAPPCVLLEDESIPDETLLEDLTTSLETCIEEAKKAAEDLTEHEFISEIDTDTDTDTEKSINELISLLSNSYDDPEEIAIDDKTTIATQSSELEQEIEILLAEETTLTSEPATTTPTTSDIDSILPSETNFSEQSAELEELERELNEEFSALQNEGLSVYSEIIIETKSTAVEILSAEKQEFEVDGLINDLSNELDSEIELLMSTSGQVESTASNSAVLNTVTLSPQLDATVDTNSILANDVEKIINSLPKNKPRLNIKIPPELWLETENELGNFRNSGELELLAGEVFKLAQNDTISVLFDVAEQELSDPSKATRAFLALPSSATRALDGRQIATAIKTFQKEEVKYKKSANGVAPNKLVDSKKLDHPTVWIRFCAMAIDTIFVLGLTLLFTTLSIFSDDIKLSILTLEAPDILTALPYLGSTIELILFIWIVSSAIFVAGWGRTIGDWLMGIEVITYKGEIPGLNQSFIRSFAQVTTLLTCGLGILLLFRSSNPQTLHDIMAKTYIQKTKIQKTKTTAKKTKTAKPFRDRN